MNKQEFLSGLREGLSGLPEDDIAERLDFYGEMIDDRMEEGLSEEEAAAGIGSTDQIAKQIIGEMPISRLVADRVKPKRRLQAWETVLLILGSPVWLSLLIAAFAVLLSVYAVLWSFIVSLWAVDLSFAAGALGGAAAGIFLLCKGGSAAQGLMMLSAGAVLAGLAIFLFFGCKAATRGVLILTKKIALGTKSLLVRKENAK